MKLHTSNHARFWLTVTTIISLSANASASDLLRGADKLKIAMPEMSPDMISFTPAECYHNDHYLPLCTTDFAQPEPAQQEWVNTTSHLQEYLSSQQESLPRARKNHSVRTQATSIHS